MPGPVNIQAGNAAVSLAWDDSKLDPGMAKTQQNVSGGFRTEAGAHIFARCRSYLDTMRKHDQDLMTGIMAAMGGKPWIPPMSAEVRKRSSAA